MTVFWTLVVNIGIIIVAPCIILTIFLQNCATKASSVKDKKEANILAKVLGVLMLYGIFFWDPDMYIGTWRQILDISNDASMRDAFGIVALAFIVMWLCFYYIIVNKRNMKAFYRYRIVRWLAIAMHIIDSILVIVFLWVSNANTDIDYDCWRWLLLSNYILMVSIVVLDAFRVGYEKEGQFFEYNNIIRQIKIFTYNGKKIDIIENGDEFIVTNGDEEVRMTKLLPYQENGVKGFKDIIKE
ncbi:MULTISPECIES: hypothetical protein [Butyrivibrio]|uniref:hypothetical protein n=1 Tax=Butyrivibrio TaxID=830 RepID=UPI00040EADB8|nr:MULTISPECIES: hypothetical protein [Butyrivibrio]